MGNDRKEKVNMQNYRREDFEFIPNVEIKRIYKKLLEFLKNKPPEYAESTARFWEDEHISKFMLEAHLNPDIGAASRQHAFISASARWIGDVVGDARPLSLLDLGCGAGLYAQAFAAMGLWVTGIDFAKRSIDYAKEQAALKNMEIAYYCKNYLAIEYESPRVVAG